MSERPAMLSDVNRLHERMDDLGHQVSEGLARLGEKLESSAIAMTRLTTEHGVCQGDMARCKVALFGNGQPGVVRGVEDLRKDVIELKADKDERKATWKWWHVTLVGLACSAVAGGFAQGCAVLFKHVWP